MTTSVHIKGVIFAILAALCWGAALVMSKGIVEYYPPLPLLLLQLCSSVLFLWLILFIGRIAVPNLTSLLRVSLLGLLEPFLTYMLVLTGLTYARASDAALLQSLESIFIVMLSAVLFKERPGKRFMVLSGVMLGGLYLSIGGGLSTLAVSGIVGNLLIITGMFSAACYVVFTARMITVGHPLVIVAIQQTCALIATGGIFIGEYLVTDRQPFLPPNNIALLAIGSGIVQYALAFTFYLMALKNISAGLAGMFLNLIPVFGIAGAGLFLHEKLGAAQMAGSVITVGALLLMSAATHKSDGK